MKIKNLILYLVLFVITIGSILICVALHDLWRDWRLVNEPLHSTMEALGALAAIFMAILLFERKQEEYNGKLLFLAIGFLSMGLLGVFHALISLGRGFVLLYSMSNLVGGLCFALIWLPWHLLDRDGAWKRWLPWIVVIGSLFFLIWTLIARETLPVMVRDGKFTGTAVWINLLAGVFFLAAAGRLLLDFHHSKKMEFYLLGCMAVLLGTTGLMFRYSSIWGSSWWFWHLMRLITFLLVPVYLSYEYRQKVSDLRVTLAERKQAEEALRVTHHFLEIANRHREISPLLKEFVAEVKKFTGCTSVGIRILDKEGNIPYQAYEGFSRRFYESESPLSIKLDQCMCINVVKGVFDAKPSYYTKGGSFYMNATTRFLNTLSEEEKRQTRNVCNQFGYESVALAPIRVEDRTLGLIHVADSKENMVPLEMVEGLEKISMQLGTAIQRVQVEETLERQRQELAIHTRILSTLLWTVDLDERLNLILDEVLAFLKVEFGCIHLVQNNEVVLRSWRGIPDALRAQVLSFPIDEVPNLMKEQLTAHEQLSEQGITPDFLKHERIQAWTSVPLRLPSKEGKGKEWFGVIIVASRRYEALDEDQVRALIGVSDQLALAIDNVRTYRQAQERLARLQALREIDRAIMQRLDLMEVLHVVLEHAPKEFGADAAAISLLDEKELRTKVFAMRHPNGTIVDEEAFALADSLLHWFVERKEPVIIYDLTVDPRVQMHRNRIRNGKLISYLGVPLVVYDKTIGVFHILTIKPKVFADEDVGFFSTMGGQIAIAIENARATGALRESEKKYRDLVDNALVGIYKTNLKGEVLYVNEAFLKILEFETPEELMAGGALVRYKNPRDREALIENLKRTGKVTNFETILLTKTGRLKNVLASATLDGDTLSGMVMDITERKRAEEALRKGEERFKELYDNAPLGYHEFDIEGRITQVNRTELQMLGYEADEILGRYVWEFIVEEEDSQKAVMAKLKGTLTPGRAFERNYKRKDGTTLPVLIEDRLIMDEEGRVIGIRSAIQDITERKQLEEQLRQSQKMEAIGRLAGGIAHDFNNLLTVIRGYSQLSLIDLKEGDPQRGNLEEIEKATERAADLIRKLLAFSRRQVMEMKVIDLNTIFENLEKMLHRVIGEDIELRTVLAENLGRVKADRGQIEQVIMNLAVNARDAMPEGGKVTIETVNVELDEVYARNHIAVTPGHYVMFSISDTGIGMTPEVRERVFEPFFTTKEKGKGTGLGLSTVYGIVKQSGGNIWVYSEPGKGTTFKIYLPRVDEPLEKLEKKVEVKEIPHGSETILVVEDDEEVRKLTVGILRNYGYAVLEASQGLDAFLICEGHKGPIHLLVTDVVMPKMSGRELADRLAEIHPKIKVLYMSGYADNAITYHGILEKGMNYIQKPFTIDGLARKVREVLNQ